MIPNAIHDLAMAAIPGSEYDGCTAAEATRKAELLIGMSNAATMAAAAIEAQCIMKRYYNHMRAGRDMDEANVEAMMETAQAIERALGVPLVDYKIQDRIMRRRERPGLDRIQAIEDQFTASGRRQLSELIVAQNSMMRYDTLETMVVDPLTGQSVTLDEMQRRMILRGKDLESVDVDPAQTVVSSAERDLPPIEDATLDPETLETEIQEFNKRRGKPRSSTRASPSKLLPMGALILTLWIVFM